MDQRLDLESGTIHDLNKPAPGMWRFPKNPALCCIYRVPNSMRQVNPEAYTPQIVLIGPLHHSLKSQALNYHGDITNTKLMNYLNMERHKKIYLAKFAKRVGGGEKIIDGLRRTIEEDEEMIRESYSESTAWIESPEFVEMILHDSVFILEFMLRNYEIDPSQKTGDPLMDEPCQGKMVRRDLGLLENQLPYFLLDKLFEPIIHTLFHRDDITFRRLVIHFFYYINKIGDDSTFKHFTDLSRCVLVETLPGKYITHKKILELNEKYHAYKLYKGGVTFNAVDDEKFSLAVLSMDVEFKNGCLNIPCFYVDGHSEMKLRNIMALEQCHYPYKTHVCDYIFFMDSLIDTEEDVALLVEKGIIKHFLGDIGSVATMVNKLSWGVVNFGSYYSVIAKDVNSYYKSSWTKSRAVLKSVYFSNPWRGTATVTAALLLLLTLIQTVTSVMQVLQKNMKP
ncbi:unnamed protein product [Microthlaspi erraticum]|uniref:Uncharacterized protein n=1 Tax=Microthlaspi erraticum TaxID=1685480 RepID=A0A6D2ID03_9BRAS|nr:unnamed protein product [Microthlaspi erraticum]